MSFTAGQKVIVQNRVFIVLSDETIGTEEVVGVVPPQAIQYVPAGMVNVPPATPPAGPASPPPATPPVAHPTTPPARPGR